MSEKLFSKPKYTEEGDVTYFEVSKTHQEKIQTQILKKNEKSEILPHEIADAAHILASKFFTEVGKSFDVDCEQGCSYCCYQPATVFAFEAIRIASVLKNSLSVKQLEELKEKMKSRVRGFKDDSVRKNLNNKTACPLLVNEECSVYENRPLTCRMAHSFSVKKCRLSFEKDRAKVEVPMSLELLTGISGIIEGAFEGLPKKKLDGNLYELCSAVLVALSNTEAASKWAKGDHGIFKDCIKDDT